MHWYGNLPVVLLEGSPQERGFAHGQNFGEQIGAYLGKIREADALRNSRWDRMLKTAQRYQEYLEREMPAAFQELEGIAHGAQQSLAAIVAINGIDEVREGCTSLVALPEATLNGHTLIGKNRDGNYALLQTDALFIIIPEHGARFATLASVGTLARDGISQTGIAVLGNGLSGREETGPRISSPLFRRHLLAQSTMDQVEGLFSQTRPSQACNYTIAFASGQAMAVEATASRVFNAAPKVGLLVHTNHFISPDASGQKNEPVKWGGRSRFRLKRVRAVLGHKLGRLTLQDIQRALADHAEHPNSVCSHRTEDGAMGGTLNSYWMDLNEGVFHIANGPPCVTPAVEIPLSDWGIGVQPGA